MVITTATSIKVVCTVSVQMMVRIPPLKVYNQINRMVTTTLIQNGIPHWLKMLRCNTLATRNNLKEAPIIRDNRKKEAPVLYDQNPNLPSR